MKVFNRFIKRKLPQVATIPWITWFMLYYIMICYIYNNNTYRWYKEREPKSFSMWLNNPDDSKQRSNHDYWPMTVLRTSHSQNVLTYVIIEVSIELKFFLLWFAEIFHQRFSVITVVNCEPSGFVFTLV